MVSTPKTRHSRSRREPVTIELDPGAVARIPDDEGRAADAMPDDTAAEASPTDAADAAAHAPDGETTEQQPLDEGLSDTAPADSEKSPQDAPDAAELPGYGFEADKPHDDEPARYSREEREADAGSGMASDFPVPPPTRRGGPSAILAGIIGAIVALIIAGGLQYAGILGAPVSTGSVPDVDGVLAEVAALKQEIATFKQGSGDNGALADQIDGLSTALDTVKTDLAALQQAVSAGAGGENAGLKALDGRVKQIETAIAKLGTGGNSSAADVAALGKRISEVEALVKTAGAAATAGAGRIAALEKSLADIAGKIDAQASQPKIAAAIATAALKAAVDRGAPFTAELDTLAAIAPDSPELAALRSHAEKGVATRDALIEEADAAATAMIAAATPVDASAGFFDRLLDSAESLVTVRPIGAVEGKGVPETTARMEAAIKGGDLTAALAEFDTLPDPVKAAGAAFAERIRARLEVERLVEQATAGAMKAA